MSAAAGLIVLAGRLMFGWFFGAKSGLARAERRDDATGRGLRRIPGPIRGRVGVGHVAHRGVALTPLGIWIDLGAVMIAVFLALAGMYFHRFWQIEDATQRRTQEHLFYRNFIGIGAWLIMFGTFATLGPALRYTITAPLFTF